MLSLVTVLGLSMLMLSAIPARSSAPPGFVIASAVDSSPEAIASADYVCKNKNDICLALDKACQTCRDSKGAQVRGLTIYVRSGTYEYDRTPEIDGSWIMLQGEGQPFWQAFNGPWPTPSTEGANGGTKFKLVPGGPGKNGITIGKHFPPGGYRQQGIKIQSIYFYGYGADSGAGIFDDSNADGSEIASCLIHNYKTGIDIAWDTPDIHDNNVQSCYGSGIVHRFVYAKIHGNILYDIGGSGIELYGANGKSGDVVTTNVIGSYGASVPGSCGILVSSQANSITGNTITGNASQNGDGIRLSGTEDKPANYNAISANVITKTNQVGIPTKPNPTGSAIHLEKSASFNAITGNICVSTLPNDTGFAIWIEKECLHNTFTGNNLSGTWKAGNANGFQDETGGLNVLSGNSFASSSNRQ